MEMTGNTILITGGGSGIGLKLAENLISLRNRVVIALRPGKTLPDHVAKSRDCYSVALDQDDTKSISDFAERVRHEHPDVNVLINNAGIQKPEDLAQAETSDAEQQITTNLLGPIRVTAALMTLLLAKEKATIINVSSALGFVPQSMTPTYCATKAAIHSYTQSLRWQLRKTGVEVVEIIPPWVQTGLQGDRGNHSAAMPLDEFIEEVMAILSDLPSSKEVVVDRAKPMRFADRAGDYDAFYERFNASRGA